MPDPSGLQLRIDGKVAATGETFSDGGSVETSSDGIENSFSRRQNLERFGVIATAQR